jgi:uncharacterized DUF497 family protein
MNTMLKKSEFVAMLNLLAIFLGATIASAAAPMTIRKYPIPDHGALELNVPTSWKVKVHNPQEDLPPTIIFTPAKGNDFELAISVMWNKTGEPSFNKQDRVQTLVEKDGQKLLSKTVETNITLREIKGVSNTGYYFSVTDKAPDPGEYRYMTHGAIGVGNLLLSTTILHRVKESESVKDALFMLLKAKQSTK